MMDLRKKNKVTVSIIIPCWNGKLLLEKNLPAVMKLGADEIIIVDDASTDESVKYISKTFLQIKLISHQKNLGFAKSCNDGVKIAKGEIIVLLNQDVLPSENLLKFILLHFKDEKVFAVSFNEKQWSWGKLIWKNGFVEHLPGDKPIKAHISGWASGGSAAFKKSIWDTLGGLDLIYHPFYWEDIDLSYRAWKMGFKVIWEPKAVVEHEHEVSIGANFSKDYIDFISARNQLTFIWKNITDLSLLISHIWGLLAKIIKSPGYIKIVFAALLRLPWIISSWWYSRFNQKIKDKEIFSFLAD